jgi:hypothetical protein
MKIHYDLRNENTSLKRQYDPLNSARERPCLFRRNIAGIAETQRRDYKDSGKRKRRALYKTTLLTAFLLPIVIIFPA